MHILSNVFIRLFIDLNQPDDLRGSIRVLPQGEPIPFTNDQELLSAMHEIRLNCLAVSSISQVAQANGPGAG